MSSNPISLEVLRIEEPCHADWNEMAGDDRKRFCQGCQKYVHNFAAMTRDEAERLVCESAGSLCARMPRDAQGTVITFDYEKKKGILARRGWRFWSCVGVFSALAGAFIQSVLGIHRAPLPTAAAPATKPVQTPTTLYGAPMGVMICPPSRNAPATPSNNNLPPGIPSNLQSIPTPPPSEG